MKLLDGGTKRSFRSRKPHPGKRSFWRLEGVDCLAEYFLNGKPLGKSENAFMPHEFDLTDRLSEQNTLWIHIRSALLEQLSFPYEQYLPLRMAYRRRCRPAETCPFFWVGYLSPGSDGRTLEKRQPACGDGYDFEELGYLVRFEGDYPKAGILFQCYRPAQPAWPGTACR